jgi:dTDP-4-amino-4,6-dideoxygalactose transaminase
MKIDSSPPPALPPIPFNRPFFVGKELHYIAQAVALGNIAGDGEFTERCASILQKSFAIPKVLMTPSCTASLEMAAMLCQLEPGDEVILPSFTFVSTAAAFVREGAKPVFVDIRPDTLNLDESQIESAITPRTKVICPVHYAGVGCEMDAITDIAKRHNLLVVEDAAQGVNSWYRGRGLGSIGHIGCYSFHETKNFICGEGGALCLNDPLLIERAEVLRDKGTNRRRFFRGQVDKYTWIDVGSSYVPSEIASAFLCAQLEQMDSITRQRQTLMARYRQELQSLANQGAFELPYTPSHCQNNAHMFYLLLPSQGVREEFIAFLKVRGITSVFHYVPLHNSPMGLEVGRAQGTLPVTDSISSRLVRLPMYYDLSTSDQDRVLTAIHDFVTRPSAADKSKAEAANAI